MIKSFLFKKERWIHVHALSDINSDCQNGEKKDEVNIKLSVSLFYT